MKKQVIQYREELYKKNEEIAQMKKIIKITKINELQIEKLSYQEENTRLKNLL